MKLVKVSDMGGEGADCADDSVVEYSVKVLLCSGIINTLKCEKWSKECLN